MKMFITGFIVASMMIVVGYLFIDSFRPAKSMDEIRFASALQECRAGKLTKENVRRVVNLSDDQVVTERYCVGFGEVNNYQTQLEIKRLNDAYMECKAGNININDLADLWFTTVHKNPGQIRITQTCATKAELIRFLEIYQKQIHHKH